jgi:UDP-N-acetyl-D-mannosaminuronic acid dehydrogenase
LVGGEDFQVVFAPERTIEGNALQELRTLPQVIGGLTEYCVEEASRFWSTLTPSLVRVQSLEAAELVKLANNTFRDLSFAFANEMAWLCEQYNIDAFGLIQAANEGYPRNPIPRPSPGVGGYCLTKDPYIYTSPLKGNYQPLLGEVSRRVNGLAPQRVIGYIERFIETQGLDWSQLTILIAGFAFKGIPDTSDLRGSVTLDILALLPDNLREVRAFDAAVPLAKLAALAVTPVTTLEIGLAGADVVLFLNNHPQHTRFNLYSGLSQMRKPALLFDGWHQLNELEVLQIPGMTYATLGYQNHR